MVKKLQKMAEKQAASTARLLDSQLAQTVKDSAQQIWLAGLGAFAKAQGEGGKVFDTLMKEGMNLHRKTQGGASGKLGDMADRMSAMAGQVAGQVGSQANAQWDKLESIFEERTSRALGRLGVPTARDIAALSARVDALAAAVAALAPAPSAAAAAPAAPRTAARKVRAAAQPVAKKATRTSTKTSTKATANKAATAAAAKPAPRARSKAPAKAPASAAAKPPAKKAAAPRRARSAAGS